MRRSDQHSPSVPPDAIGVGYLHHCIPAHQRYFERLRELDAPLDMIEYLAAHFAHDPGYLAEISADTGSLPSTLHSYEYMLGSVDRPGQETVDRLQLMAMVSNCRWIGEHIGMVGTAGTYSGTFLQPFGTDEQTEQFVTNLRSASARSACPIIVENQPQVFGRVGPRRVCEQVADVSVEADVGILLSLSNIIVSDSFHPMDREAELDRIPLERVWQVHLPLPHTAELAEMDLATLVQDTHWAFTTLEQLYATPEFAPAAVIFEVQSAGTPSTATAEQLCERLIWAREMMGLGAAAKTQAVAR